MRLRVSLATIALAILCVGCSPLGDEADEPAIPDLALPTLVLQPEDLLDVFTRFDEGPLAIADAPFGDRADPERFGRIGGWKARYRRQGSSATRGPLVVESRVDLFAGAGGAGREFDAYVDELELELRHPSASQLREVEDLGDEAVVLVPGASAVQDALASYTVVWRDENAAGSIVANGFEGKIVLDQVLELARAQQRRIAAAATTS